MASVTEKPQPKKPLAASRGSGEELVDRQIGRTRRALKTVDLTAGLITLAIGVLAYLLTMSLLEHWVVPGGWSDGARGSLFAVLLIGCLVYSWRAFWPLLRQPINPAYAALAIEQSSPSLKNSLLNLLLLRNRKRELSRQVYQAIESQAAQSLSQVRMETVVDRSAILRLGYILVALTAVCVLYRVLSPKDLFSSAGRVLLPWSDIAVPSRVTISNVTPGDAKAARGEQLKVTAEVLGLEPDELVQLVYTTADEQIVRQQIPMTGSDSGTLFRCKVPARLGGGDQRGVQQDFRYWIEAGDVSSPKYSVSVFARPTLVVNRLRYDYPAYTGYPSREVEHTGDIRAVEGTRVTVFAQANKPIKSAHVDFEADGRHDLLMNSTDQQASVTFPLTLREDRRTPKHRSYVLKYITIDGNPNQSPPKYQIDVQPDYAPEIQLLLPEEAVLEVALNQEVNFELEARDPDFALSQVMLVGKVGDEVKLQHSLLTLSQTGKFVGKLRKTPEQIGLKPGDVLEYWGAASDNRRPEPNLAYSVHRKLRVVGPWRGDEQGEQNNQGQGQQQGENGEPSEGEGEGGQDGQAGGGEQGNSSEGEGQEGAQGQSGNGEQGSQNEGSQQQQGGGQGESNKQPDDGNDSQGQANGNSPSENGDGDSQDGSNEGGNNKQEANQQASDNANGQDGQGKVSSEGDDDGSAFERMAEHFNEQGGQSNADKSQSDAQPSNAQSGGEPSNPADKSEASQQRDSSSTNEAGSEQAGNDKNGQEDSQAGESADGTDGQQPQQQDDSPDQNASPDQGDAGAGDRSGDQQGAPESAGEKKPQDKQSDGSDGPQQQNSEAPAEGRDQSESDSEGGQGGDRSGGGQEGAGQQADESGKGSAGQNEAADRGAGRSSEPGEGETGEQAGDQDTADGKTGESSGDQRGNGSEQGDQTGDRPDGDAAADNQQGTPGGQPTEGQPNDSPAGNPGDQSDAGQQPQMNDAAAPANQDSTGNPAGTGGQPSPPPGSELQDADDPNLKFAEQQTDLILDRLEDQLKKKEVDRSLLEKLGWTQQELRRFVDRWKGLKSQASDDPRASDELNDALRSLGLNRNRRTQFQSKINKDRLRDLQEAYRVRVPLEYQDQVNRYIKGTADTQETE